MRTARHALRSFVQHGDELCIAPQNIAEFWNVCTRTIEANGLGNSIAATDRLTSRIEIFFTILPDTMEVFRHWRRLVVRHEVKGAKVRPLIISADPFVGIHVFLNQTAEAR